MKRISLLAICGGITTILLAPAIAAPLAADHASRDDDGDYLLRAAAFAGLSLAFEGTQVVSAWSATGATSAVVTVAHQPGAGSVLRVAATAAGPGGTYFRPDDAKADGPTAELAALLDANYEAVIEGNASVAGRPALVVAVRPPGGSPVARLWLDRATSLPLRRQALDGQGRTVRETAFLDIRVGATSRVAEQIRGARTMPAPVGQPVASIERLVADGWLAPPALSSSLRLYDARVEQSAAGPVVHLTYADGLATVSVFQLRGRVDDDDLGAAGWRGMNVAGRKVWVEDGFPRRVTWSSRGTVFTVVADCPDTVLEQVVTALPHGEPSRGVLTRLGSGAARVGSWFNPFA